MSIAIRQTGAVSISVFTVNQPYTGNFEKYTMALPREEDTHIGLQLSFPINVLPILKPSGLTLRESNWGYGLLLEQLEP